MLKKLMLLTLLLGLLAAPLAWGQNDPGCHEDAIQVSDESAGVSESRAGFGRLCDRDANAQQVARQRHRPSVRPPHDLDVGFERCL